MTDHAGNLKSERIRKETVFWEIKRKLNSDNKTNVILHRFLKHHILSYMFDSRIKMNYIFNLGYKDKW